MRLGYFADGKWSHNALEKLLDDDSFEVCFICARFDNPDPVLMQMAKENSIDFITHANINSDEFIENITNYNCDLLVSMSFNQIFKRRLINLTEKKIINCHAGKLPFYRGRNVLNWALINDEPNFGITVHYVDEGIDTGDIILQENHQITDDDDYSTLLKKSHKGCADLLFKSIKQIQNGVVEVTSQNEIDPIGFYCSKRQKGDELINWNQTSREIFNFVRALCRPGPQATTFNNGKKVLINKVKMIDSAPNYIGIPGSVIKLDEHHFYVKTQDSFVNVVEWNTDSTLRVGSRLS